MSNERNATAAWAHDMSNQRIRDLEAQLATATAERDALTLELSHLRPEWQAVCAERDAAVALTNRYGADQWRRGNAGQEPQEFAEWQKEARP